MKVPLPIDRYLRRHAEHFPEASSLPEPKRGLRLCVVIPALAERENVGRVLESLAVGSSRIDQAEVIVVVNNPVDAPERVLAENLETIQQLTVDPGSPNVLALDRASPTRAYPRGVAGVGAARRTGMDLALRRLVAAGRPERSAIACLDADSPVSAGYVDRLLSVFDVADPPMAATCALHHPIPQDEALARAIVSYELWLRYVENGLLLAGSPYAFQTVGSCMLVSPVAYALADGMPRKRAAEDFYFLQKVIKVAGPGRLMRLAQPVVFPSARVSGRVPFGTGRAMRRCLEEDPGTYLTVEPPQAFFDLRSFFRAVPGGFENPAMTKRLTPAFLSGFIDEQDGWSTLEKLREHAADAEHFARAVHTWFDSLQVVRYARRSKAVHGGRWIFEAILEVQQALGSADAFRGLALPARSDPAFPLQLRWLERMREPDAS